MGFPRFVALVALPFWLLPGSIDVLAADPDDEGEEEAGSEEGEGEEVVGRVLRRPTELTEREKSILELFKANEKTFRKGRIYLKYDFERQIEDLVEDWSPTLAQAGMRVRWARGIEGMPTTVEHGIILGDYGEWIHKAVFVRDLEVQADILSVARYKIGNILGPVFFSEKKKRSIGANAGSQIMSLAGWKHAKPPLGKERVIPSCDRHVIGYKYEGNLFETYVGKKKLNDTLKFPKLTDGMESGHVGMAWNGSIQCFLYSVTIEGTLDPAWVAKQLGESVPPKEEKKGTETGSKKALKKK